MAYQVGDEVNLFSLPVPLFASEDGGPMITAGLIIAREESGSLNSGVYRLMLKEKNLTGIDIVTPNDLRRIVEHNTMLDKPTPISINIGTHPRVFMGATLMPGPGVDELEIAGGMLGEPVKLTACQTQDVPCIADSEIVMEAEVLPTGWTKPEGRFGEFHRSMGALHWNPQVRITAVYTRKDPIYYAFHMPWEVIHFAQPIVAWDIQRKFKEAHIDLKGVNVTRGGSSFFHAVIAIDGRPGEGKRAIMSALSSHVKHVVVVDGDIDVFNPTDVEWAIATRVQADKDVVIVSGMPAKPLDPSLELAKNSLPTTAKMGIDATIPGHLPKERFEPVKYAFEDEVDVESYLADDGGSVGPAQSYDLDSFCAEIRQLLEDEGAIYYADIVKRYWLQGLQAVSSALGLLHEQGDLWQDLHGRLCLRDSPHAAEPPSSKLTSRV